MNQIIKYIFLFSCQSTFRLWFMLWSVILKDTLSLGDWCFLNLLFYCVWLFAVSHTESLVMQYR